ncbi:MAG: hypothetical protein PHF37_08770 [Phycisphaerae bacterium]|nr:hypothetical protein [Phycisphaerae bacterium]
MAEEIKIQNRASFSGWPMIIGWIAMLIFALHACTHMVGAGDTWVAMACGRHFINHGVDTVEPFSANSHRAGPTAEEVKTWPDWAQWVTDKVGLETVKYWHPTGWVNQNWLTHVIFYWLTTESPFADAGSYSFNTLVYWKFAIYIIAIACVYYISRLLKVNPALAVTFACFALFTGRSLLDIRPAGFSNLMTAVFLLILTLAAYKDYRFIWLLVPAAVFWCNVHGGYIYLFIMMIPFIGTHFLLTLTKKWTAIVYSIGAVLFLFFVFNRIGWNELKADPKAQSWIAIQLMLLTLGLIVYGVTVIFNKNSTVTISLKALVHTFAATVVSFVAVIIFNPFHLTNLTHTFIISASKHAEQWRTVNEWHPAFEWNNPVGDEIPFLWMYIIAWLVIVIWFFVMLMVRSKQVLNERQKQPNDSYELPKLDLALVLIAILTIYMAIRSRRFIPIAAIVACPLIALLINQTIRSIAAMINLNKNNKFKVPPMPSAVRFAVISIGIASVLYFGTWWGSKFKHVYLDPWPGDKILNSMFMRMTASDVKPFWACEFIRKNKLSGNMFNYWTEGGFIAYGQDPDPNTGKTPLQLFMDGRAQAAYDHKTYEEWMNIMSGGPVVYRTNIRRERLDTKDYIEIGKYLDEKLKEHNVWVILMPVGQLDTAFVRGIEHNSNWFLAYYNEQQKLWVDITTPQGKQFMEDILTGKAKFPDDFSRNLVLAYNVLFRIDDSKAKQEGVKLAIQALNEHPCQPAMQVLIYAARFSELRPAITEAISEYYDDFVKSHQTLSKEDGYQHKAIAAINAAGYLGHLARSNKDPEKAEQYNIMQGQIAKELNKLTQDKRW